MRGSRQHGSTCLCNGHGTPAVCIETVLLNVHQEHKNLRPIDTTDNATDLEAYAEFGCDHLQVAQDAFFKHLQRLAALSCGNCCIGCLFDGASNTNQLPQDSSVWHAVTTYLAPLLKQFQLH